MRLITPAMSKTNKIIVRIVALLLPVVCLWAFLTPTVFAQTTYVITDGDQVKVHKSFEKNPAVVLTEAGVELRGDDVYTTAETEGVAEITVQRSQTITVNNCGEQMTVTSYGETLDELFSRYDIPAYGDYIVSEPMDTMTFDGMEVTVDYIIDTNETYTVDIPFEVTYCYDPSMPEGAEKVLIEGTVGQKLCKAVATYVNSQESNRTVLEETVIQQPVNRVVRVGTGEAVGTAAPAIGDGVIVTADGEILTFSKKDEYKTTAYTHTDAGCNMTTATGTTVRLGTVAVDPKVIPYGTRMFIVSSDGRFVYGIATAEDCGGGVKDKHIDLYFPTVDECWQYGIRNATVYFLN